METEFNNACFENRTGEIVMASTRYGVHIIKIEAQSKRVQKVQIATIVHTVYPSNETNQDYYNRAVKFRGKSTNLAKFEEQAKEIGFDPRIVPDISKDQRNITGLGNAPQIIGWAYTSSKGDISNIFEVEDEFIVAALTDVKENGYADFESVRNEVELAVLKEKKAEKIQASMKSALANTTNLEEFASNQGLEVKEAEQVQFSNSFVSGIGLEPYIVGIALTLPLEQMAGPFIGENGVYVLRVNNRQDADLTADTSATKNRLGYTIQSRTTYEAYNAMLQNADIEDNRLRVFYGRR